MSILNGKIEGKYELKQNKKCSDYHKHEKILLSTEMKIFQTASSKLFHSCNGRKIG